ncbi:hypothetical protein K438DRAFT_1947159 [Mycena galopus ATCC 62051]|nr:hypothetical protein K438DRAFT_1947159 [Mycena galopus ATCC 62051]
MKTKEILFEDRPEDLKDGATWKVVGKLAANIAPSCIRPRMNHRENGDKTEYKKHLVIGVLRVCEKYKSDVRPHDVCGAGVAATLSAGNYKGQKGEETERKNERTGWTDRGAGPKARLKKIRRDQVTRNCTSPFASSRHRSGVKAGLVDERRERVKQKVSATNEPTRRRHRADCQRLP